MDKRKKIFLIIGIIIIGVVISAISIIIILTSNLKNDEYPHQKTIYLEGKEDYIIHAYAVNFAGHQGDTLTFSFTTNPNGLIEVYLNSFDLFIATNITNYELVLPDDSCSLTFANLELFDIIISLSYKFK